MLILGFLIGFIKRSSRNGYTLMEVAVSISIIMMIMFIAVGYSKGMDRQLALIRAQTQIVALLNHAKGLSQNFLLSPPSSQQICGYGASVNVSSGLFQVFQDLVPTVSSCDTGFGINVYNSGEELKGAINQYQLDMVIFEFNAFSPSYEILNNVVFIPPDPTVKINADSSIESAYVGVRLKAAKSSRFDIRVNKFGQITKQ